MQLDPTAVVTMSGAEYNDLINQIDQAKQHTEDVYTQLRAANSKLSQLEDDLKATTNYLRLAQSNITAFTESRAIERELNQMIADSINLPSLNKAPKKTVAQVKRAWNVPYSA